MRLRSVMMSVTNVTWLSRFNGHLRKKGISGHIKVDYEQKVLSVEVTLLLVFAIYRFHMY